MPGQFNPLSGTELKEVILKKIGEALEESDSFRANITYPWVKYSFEVKMTSYPKNAADSEPEKVAEEEVELGEASVPTPKEAELVVVSSGPEIVDTPDQARVDADLPLPTPTPVVGVGIVDKMVKVSKKGK